MKHLLILRHAKSSWDNPALDDHDRPLNKRGRGDAPRMGELLKEQDLLPDVILASTARRVRETVARVIDASEYQGPIHYDRQLYHADPADHIQALQTLPGDPGRVLIVGHNPGLQDWLEQLLDTPCRVPTAALAWVELDLASWADLDVGTAGRLQAIWRPKELP